MNRNELVGILEGALFAAGDGITLNEFCRGLEKSIEEILEALKILKEDLKASGRGVRLVQVKETYQLSTKPEYYDEIRSITQHKQKTGLSRAALETLSIIAYRQPVTRVAIDEIRGVSSSSAIQRLYDRGLISEGGRLEAPGRPILYKTTKEFLKSVGFQSLKEMPEFEVFSNGTQETFDFNKNKDVLETKIDFNEILTQAIKEENKENLEENKIEGE
ncbi:MAG: SMC-Scp complex subunit ScpB [Eubacteriaceae bacterium]